MFINYINKYRNFAMRVSHQHSQKNHNTTENFNKNYNILYFNFKIYLICRTKFTSCLYHWTQVHLNRLSQSSN